MAVSGSTLTYNSLMFNSNGGLLLTGNDNIGFGNLAIGGTSGLLSRF